MTFHCKNYDINKDKCKMLQGECIPGRRVCVLEGRVALSEELEAKIRALDNEKPSASWRDVESDS